jgi:hypothetical protein
MPVSPPKNDGIVEKIIKHGSEAVGTASGLINRSPMAGPVLVSPIMPLIVAEADKFDEEVEA